MLYDREFAIIHLCNKANFFKKTIEEIGLEDTLFKMHRIKPHDYFIDDYGMYQPSWKKDEQEGSGKNEV